MFKMVLLSEQYKKLTHSEETLDSLFLIKNSGIRHKPVQIITPDHHEYNITLKQLELLNRQIIKYVVLRELQKRD